MVAGRPKIDTNRVEPKGTVSKELNLWALSGEIGWKLAVPIVVLVIAGAKLDKAYHSTPLFIVVGIGLSLTVSVILIARMIAKVGR